MPAVLPTCSSTRCSPAFCIICARSRPPFASSTPMPAPASTISPAPRRPAAANGTTASRRLMAAPLDAGVAALLAPYLDVVGALNERGRLKLYPGSPALARAWLRPQDRLIACELEPKAARALAAQHARRSRASRRWKSTAGPRSRLMCRRRNGAAWCWSIRRSRRTAISSSSRAGSPRRTANGPTGIYAAVVPDQGPARARRAGQAAAPLRHRQDAARRAHGGAALRPDPAQRLRADLVNPPWTLENELSDAVAGTGRAFSAGRARAAIAWIGSRGEAAQGGRPPESRSAASFHRPRHGVYFRRWQ